jgi:hypothetical protein
MKIFPVGADLFQEDGTKLIVDSAILQSPYNY